jgi:hypothetical protein
MTAFTATSTGVCSACFNKYHAGTRLVVIPTGKVQHVACGHANMVASAVERRTSKRSSTKR